MGLFNGIALLILMTPFGATLPSSGRLAFASALVPQVFLPIGDRRTAVALDVIPRLILVARSTPKHQSPDRYST